MVVVVVKVVVVMMVVVVVVVATFEGRSRRNRCRRRNQNNRLRVRHRHKNHPRHTEELRCTFPRTVAVMAMARVTAMSAHRRSPPSGRGRGCGRAEARPRSGPPICAKQIHDLPW
jgi:hypothetical protein